MRIFHVLFLLLLGCAGAHAQEKNPYTFGKVTPEDFRKAPYAIDTGAKAVILADMGHAEYDGRSGDMELLLHRYLRVHILKAAGTDLAEFTFYLRDARDEKQDALDNLKGVTYNLENGQVVSTKLQTPQVYTSKDGDLKTVRFALPNVKAGSIIELSYDQAYYSTLSPPTWFFQSHVPTLWSQFTMQVPSFYTFAVLPAGYYDLTKTTRSYTGSWRWREGPDFATSPAAQETNGDIAAPATEFTYTVHNLPGLNPGAFSSAWINYASAIQFQLASRNFTGDDADKKEFLTSWPKFQEQIMKRPDFGERLLEDNFYIKELTAKITAGQAAPEEKATAIYNWVQHNIGRDPDDYLLNDRPLKKAYQARKGTSTEINLLLVEMLRAQGLDAWPIVLSTRSHGRTYADYPLERQYNYAIVWLNMVNGPVMLDASEPELAFGKLPLRCYNGHARLLTPDAPAIMLDPDSLHETDVTFVQMHLDKEGAVNGSMELTPGYHHSLWMRQRKKAFLEEHLRDATGLPHDVITSNVVCTGLDSALQPVSVKADFTMPATTQPDIIYLQPIADATLAENPFKETLREYPVEFGYPPETRYTVIVTLPDNYKVEELPKSAAGKLPDGSATFRYVIAQQNNTIQVRLVIKCSKSVYQPDEYEALRSFYTMTAQKVKEQIVLRRQQ